MLPQGPARTWCADVALESLMVDSDSMSVSPTQLRTLIDEAASIPNCMGA